MRFSGHDSILLWCTSLQKAVRAASNNLGRLGMKARAAGISLIFDAQRPDLNVILIQLRDNLGNRLILRVPSEGTSRIVLDEKGAHRLLGIGYLAAKLKGEATIINGQVPFVKPETLKTLVFAIGTV